MGQGLGGWRCRRRWSSSLLERDRSRRRGRFLRLGWGAGLVGERRGGLGWCGLRFWGWGLVSCDVRGPGGERGEGFLYLTMRRYSRPSLAGA